MKLSFLEQTGVARILVTLLGGKKTYSELRELVSISPGATQRALRILLKENLVEELREKTFPRRRILYLTSKGRKVAILLKKIEEVLEEEP